MDDLRDMALFVELARAGSVSKAARRLGMPASSITERIGELEAKLKLKLLRRSTGAVELTDAGAIYLQRCTALIDEARQAHEGLQDPDAPPRGRLRVSLTGDFGTVFFAPFLAEFRQQYPHITIDLDLSPRRIHLLGKPFDLALRLGALEDSSLIARRLALLRVALYAAPAYIESRGALRRPEDLAKHDTIRLMRRVEATHWTLHNGKEQRRVPLVSPVTANSLGMTRLLTLLGAGIGAVDESMVRDDVARKQLVRVLPQWTLEPIAVHAITGSRILPAKTRALVDFLAERLIRPESI